jgi:tetratricopeptide (TPR) repeat protein
MAEDRILEEAIKAIENGQRARARDLLTRLLRQNQADVSYWLYMSAVVDTQKERIYCLENVLKYDPDNETALRGLVMSGGMPYDESVAPVRPLNERKLDAGEVFKDKPEDEDMPGKGRRKKQKVRMVPLMLVGVLAVALIYMGIFGIPFTDTAGLTALNTPRPTLAPLFTPEPTDTPSPTETPSGPTPTATVVLPTALRVTLEEEFTPTPRYVDTPHPDLEAYIAALQSLDAGNYGQAIGLLVQAQEALEEDPDADDLDIRYYLALLAMLSGDLEDAKREFSIIIQERPAFIAAYLGRGRTSYEMIKAYGLSESAMRSLKSSASSDMYRARNLDPDYLEAYLWIADFRLYHGEPQESLPVLEDAVELAPENALVHHYLAETYIGLDEPEMALEEAQLAFEYDPTLVKNYRSLAQALILNDREAEAYGLIQLYMEEDGNEEDPLGLYLYGRAQQAYDLHEQAVANFEAAYEIRKDNYEMSNYWASSLIALGEYEDALKRLDVPLNRIPYWFEPFQVQAEAYYYLEYYGDAKESLEDGAEYAKTDRQLAKLYYWRGKIYGALGYPNISAENWERLLEIDSDVIPDEWLREARLQTTKEPPTPTPAEPTPTRVPTSTPRP